MNDSIVDNVKIYAVAVAVSVADVVIVIVLAQHTDTIMISTTVSWHGFMIEYMLIC